MRSREQGSSLKKKKDNLYLLAYDHIKLTKPIKKIWQCSPTLPVKHLCTEFSH